MVFRGTTNIAERAALEYKVDRTCRHSVSIDGVLPVSYTTEEL